MLKVIGGEFRGRTLISVPGDNTRPPLARVREAVANIVRGYLQDARILDLFAGTGSYSIELLSHGALCATCIDRNPKAVATIKSNVNNLLLNNRVQIILGDALKVVKSLETREKPFHIVLVAPPYFSGMDQASMKLLGNSSLVDPSGIVLLQQHKKEERKEIYGNLELKKIYSYGDTRVSTFKLSRN